MDVQFVNVGKCYDDFVAVKNFNLTIEKGSLHFLLGPSGCGKTTVLRMLAGLETASSGKILFNGQDVSKIPPADRGIGMVFQNYALWPHMSVKDNIAYGLKIKKLNKKELTERLHWAMDLTHLQSEATKFPGQLSGGQQQRVALARALAIKPRILLMDEPLSNLDARLRTQMRDNICQIHEETAITTFYVTHDQKEALSMGTHITIMNRGENVHSGTPRNLYHFPRSEFLATFIGETNLLKGVVLKKSGADSCEVETALGPILACNPHGTDLSVGSAVTLSVRPEVIETSNDLQPRQNQFDMRVVKNTFLGDHEQIEVSFEDRIRLTINQANPSRHVLALGQSLQCFMPPDRTMVLEPSFRESLA